MKNLVLLLALFTGIIVVHAQDRSFSAYVQQVDSLYQNRALRESVYPEMTLVGSLHGYYDPNGSLVMIRGWHGGEFGEVECIYYVQNNAIFLYREMAEAYILPPDLDAYCENHKDKDGNCDYSGLPVNTTEISLYDTSIMVKENGNAVPWNEDQVKKRWEEAQSEFPVLLELLRKI